MKELKAEEKLIESLNDRFKAFYYANEIEKALNVINTILILEPNNAKYYFNRGLTYKVKGDLDNAITDYNKAMELNPALAEAYYSRGDVYSDKGELDSEIKDYNKAIELNPAYAESYNNRRNAYKALGMLNAAEQEIKMYKIKKKLSHQTQRT